MVLDLKGAPRATFVARLRELIENGQSMRQPAVAYRQMQHPHTPLDVRVLMRDQIFTLPTSLTFEEQRCRALVGSVMRGNALSDKHDADAAILFDVIKYGGYLITDDPRILKLQPTLQTIRLHAPYWIVTLEEFWAIYDEFVAEERKREALLATLR